MPKTVYFIGAGPGDPELLTLKGKKIIERADVIIYAGSLVNRQILSFAGKGARLIDSAPLTLEEITDEIVSASQKGLTIARVHSGDPSLYGAVAEQMELLQDKNISFEVVPGVSSVFSAAAALKLEYTLPGITQTLILTRRSGRTPVPEIESISALAGHRASMAVFLSIGMLDDTVNDLIEGGYTKDTPAAVVSKASWPDEKVIEGTLETIAEQVKREGIERQALILVGEALGRQKGQRSNLYSPDFAHGFRPEILKEKEGTAVIALTRRGWHTGMKIIHAMDGVELFLPARFEEDVKDPRVLFFENVKKEVKRLFQSYANIVLIMATGIAVRIVAPRLKSKWEDPAVVTMDDGGRNIISFLAGHWGGANELALKLSKIIGGNPVITTESDVMGFPSVDMIVRAFNGVVAPENRKLLKEIQSAILEDQDVGFYPKELRLYPDMEGHPNLHFFDSIEALVFSRCTAGLVVSHQVGLPLKTHKKIMLVHPKDLVVGIGCHKAISPQEISKGLRQIFHKQNLNLSSIAVLCTIEQKKDEKGLVDFARSQNLPLKIFGQNEINRVHVLAPESKHAMQVMGVHGVAEPCAILGAEGGKLVVPKEKLKNMTIAVAKLSLKQVFEKGEVHVNE